MAKCKDCGEPIPTPEDVCPKCGVAGGPETITDMPTISIREANTQLRKEIKEAREREKHQE